jgi:hypothetical protein
VILFFVSFAGSRTQISNVSPAKAVGGCLDGSKASRSVIAK